MRSVSALIAGPRRLILLGLVVPGLAAIAHGAAFVPLGALPLGTGLSGADHVSGNGQVVVGFNTTATPYRSEAVRWVAPTLLIDPLSDPIVEDGFKRHATAVSFDGSAIVGVLWAVPYPPYQFQPFRWTEATGYQLLPLPPGATEAQATGLSNDGVVTLIVTDTGKSYRWISGMTLEPLGGLPTDPGNPEHVSAISVSAAGDVIAGWASSGWTEQAFRWTQETGTVSIGDLPGGSPYSRASGMSSDGTTIVGVSHSTLAPASGEAFRWRADTGMVGLGFLDQGDYQSSAEFISADGRLVFGLAQGESKPLRFFVWSPQQGMRNFTDVLLQDYGLSAALTGWSDLRPADISDDSLTIVGSGINPDGKWEAWLVRLDHPIGVPEPSSLFLALASLSALRARFGRRR